MKYNDIKIGDLVIHNKQIGYIFKIEEVNKIYPIWVKWFINNQMIKNTYHPGEMNNMKHVPVKK